MRAIVVEKPGPAEMLQVTQVAEPSPGEGEVSIEVAYAGVGFVDTMFRAGVFDLPMPLTPGIEVTGRVRRIGPDVRGFEVGQPVAAMLNDFGRGPRAGGYAEVAVAHATMTSVLPENADLAQVTGVLINGVTGWLALHDLARLGVDDDVLVLGASGGLGGITGRLAALHPARSVLGVTGSAAKQAQVARAGMDAILANDLVDEIDQRTDGRGIDIVIDAVGGSLRTQAFERLAPFGRLVVLGNASGTDQALSSDAAWLGTRQVIGFSLGGVAHLIPDRVRVAATAVIRLLHKGVLHEPTPKVLPLHQAADAHHALENRSAPAKLVLAVGAA